MTEPLPQPAPDVHAPEPVAGLVRAGVLDAELAGLLWLTVENGIPLVVAGASAGERAEVRGALLALVPAVRAVVTLAGDDERFAWMPEAGELGWRDAGPAVRGTPGAVMVADLEPGGTWGEAAHLAVRALTAGYSLLATAGGLRLDDVLGRLSLPPVSAIDDELTRLGVVIILGDEGRVAIAHYLRPVARDPGGHVQRLPPAVLATWNRGAARYDHFAWGVTGELAGRTGTRPMAFEREAARRASAIAAASAAG